MPKLTRDLKFQNCFHQFFNHLVENFYPDLKEYKIVCDTKNKSHSEHQYTVTFPRKVPFYTIDVFTVDENGIITPPGTVMQEQTIPKIRHFKSHFHDYFKSHIFKSNNDILSYTDILDYWYQNETERITSDQLNNGILPNHLVHFDLKFKIVIVYHKSHIPYPVPLSTKAQFEHRCKQLESRNIELCINLKSVTEMYQEKEEQYDILRRKIRIERRNTEERYRLMFEKMQKKFREMYSQCHTTDDCPVCYESIESTKLKVPGCCHTICTDCAERCTNCPICRESY